VHYTVINTPQGVFHSGLRAGWGGRGIFSLKMYLLFISPEDVPLYKNMVLSLSLIFYNCPYGRLHSVNIPSPSVFTYYYIVQRKVMPLCTILCIEYKIILDRAKIAL
jgi:hypothetical protein